MSFLLMIGLMVLIGFATYGACSIIAWILSKVFDKKNK